MKKVLAFSAALAACAMAAQASLTPGSIAFTMYNGDANDDFSFVALAPIPAGQVIYFSDQNWTGSSFGTLSENYWTWTAPSGGVAAGSIILVTDVGSGTTSTQGTQAVNVGSITRQSANLGLNATDEVLYAYLGSANNAPTTFLTAITIGAFGGSQGTLAGTGLVNGVDAFTVAPASTDVGAYTGLRDNQLTYSSYLAQVYNIANWTVAAGSGDQSTAFRPFNTTDFTLIPTPGAVALAGVAGLVATRRRRA